ncbi:hypothetical protein OIO90_001820 [Microbotryomycetes sp. JL221]|nr:hypothetical protein OIO90_001820 [Microbotryomycetes sp. JL221]
MTALARVRHWFTWKRDGGPQSAPSGSGSEQLGVGHTSNTTSGSGSAATTPETAPNASISSTTAPAPQNSLTAESNRPPRRRRRRRRREPSPVGLPIYSEGVHDDEMVLFKDTGPVTSSRSNLVDLASPDNILDSDLQSHSEQEDNARPSPSLHPALDIVSSIANRSRASSNAASLAPSELSLTSTPPRPSTPALSPSSPPALSTARSRSSTLQSIFARNRSSTLLSSSPSNSSLRGVGGPYGAGSRFASLSSASVNSQLISAPLQHTLVASNFCFPTNGPSPSQVMFLSSREALGVYGIGDNADIAPLYGTDGDVTSQTGEGGTRVVISGSDVARRGHRASSVTSQVSSPLARQVAAHTDGDMDDSNMAVSADLSLPTSREGATSAPPILSYHESQAQSFIGATSADSTQEMSSSLSSDEGLVNAIALLSVDQPVTTPRSGRLEIRPDNTPKLELPSVVLSSPSPVENATTLLDGPVNHDQPSRPCI